MVYLIENLTLPLRSTYLSCVSPAVPPLLQSPVSLLQLLFEPGGLCTRACWEQSRRGPWRPLP